jgi:hypothetical protein
MPCDRQLKAGQSITQRKEEILRAVDRLQKALASGSVKARVGPQGSIAFVGLSESDRAGVTDACAYRRIMVSGSALARAAIARAEQMSGRTIDKQVIGQGVHSHDGGRTWHGKD